jgi:hypothetical protein
VFNETLWFGADLPFSLINPNQCRSFGIDLCDDPYDPNRQFGFTDAITGISIPFEMRGLIAGFTSRSPTKYEIENYRQVVMSSDKPWDPHGLSIEPIRPMPVEVMYVGTRLRALNAEYFRTPVSLDVDRYLAAFESQTRHHRITPEALAQMWKISLNQAKAMLDKTTQRAVRHAVHPLRRHYPTSSLDFHKHRLDMVVYTDTMFAKTRSWASHMCAQVFYTQNGFIKIIPMVS